MEPINTEYFKEGDKVTYQRKPGECESGIVKSIATDGDIFVVYHCANDWNNYSDYTAAKTSPNHLRKGWLEENI